MKQYHKIEYRLRDGFDRAADRIRHTGDGGASDRTLSKSMDHAELRLRIYLTKKGRATHD